MTLLLANLRASHMAAGKQIDVTLPSGRVVRCRRIERRYVASLQLLAEGIRRIVARHSHIYSFRRQLAEDDARWERGKRFFADVSGAQT